MQVEDRRALLSGPRSEVRAAEPLYYISASSDPTTACRLMIAADLDWVERDGIRRVDGGYLVPSCVYEMYHELLDYPPPCCSCTSIPTLGFLIPSPVYEGNNMGTRLVGTGFGPYESWVSITVEGFGTWDADDERIVLSNNALEFWNQPYPEVDSGLTEMVFTLTNRYGLTSPPLVVPVLPKPPRFTPTSYSPTTAQHPRFTLTVNGTGFLPGDGVRLNLPPPNQYAYRFYPASEVTPTRLIVPIDYPHVNPTTPAWAMRPNPIDAIRLSPDLNVS